MMFIAAIPLWLRMVPINPFFGVRLSSVMTSNERWYAVNAHAGKKLFWWSLTVIGAGIAGFYQLPRHQDAYPWAALVLTLVAVMASVISTLWWLRQNPVDGKKPKASRFTGWGGQALVAIVVAMFIRSFMITTYQIPQGNEPGVARNSHWIASRIDSGFSPGDLIVFVHESGQTWIARIVKREPDGLLLKRGGSPDNFFVKWDKVVGKMLFSHFSPDALRP
jgi:hypothetical protein